MTEYDDPIVGEIKAAVPFPVEVECKGYPDIIFHIILEVRPDRSAIEKCVSTLEDYMIKYNKLHFFRPIHYVSDIDSLPEASSIFAVCVHVDFGNANPRALIGAVKAISDANLPVYRIVLG